MNNKIPIIVICGATASGKTALSIEIAKRYGGEIVSADSMQIYKYMDIGSAKPDIKERAGIPHYMMDIIEPTKNYSVAEYTEAAHDIIADIHSQKKLPVMVGGTGLYINSVINDVDFAEGDCDEALRKELSEFAKTKGAKALHDMLSEIDPESAVEIHENNVKRVIRAIEFYRLNNKKMSEHSEQGKEKESRYSPLMLDIAWDRDVLYERINNRVDIMFEMGLADEVKRLLDMGCTADMTSMQGIGYKETVAYLKNEKSLEETKEEIKQASRRYAKRQLTWFRRDNRIKHISPQNLIKEGIRAVENFLV